MYSKMKKTKSILIFLLLIFLTQSSARRFDKCGMARELFSRGIPMSQLADWVCLVESESSYRTDVKGPPNDDGSVDWGLFQINDRYWCNGQYPGSKNVCGINCQEFLKDDITAALNCAKKIYSEGGFSKWEGWKAKCQGRNFDISDCTFEDLGGSTFAYFVTCQSDFSVW